MVPVCGLRWQENATNARAGRLIVKARSVDHAEAFDRIRELLSDILSTHEGTGKPVAEIIRLLGQVQADLRARAAAPTPRSGRPGEGVMPEPAQQRNKPKTYRVERHGNAWFLAEYREGGRQPFLCPQDVYDALAAVLAEATEPIHFEVMQEGLARHLGRTPPDYLPRVCIRFWMSIEPPLVEKIRTRYRAIRPAKLVQDARREWRQLRPAAE